MFVIDLYVCELVDESNFDVEKLEVLKFFVYWIGDIYQLLYVLINGDCGGNDILVIWCGECYINFYCVWDSEIILDYMGEIWFLVEECSCWFYFVDELVVEILLMGLEIYMMVDLFVWVQESYNIVCFCDFGYYWVNVENMIEFGDVYYECGLCIFWQQFKLVGVCLVGVLNGLLDSLVDGLGGFEMVID